MATNNDDNTILYEVALEADAAGEAALDTWLRDRVADVLQAPGFQSAEILADTGAQPGSVRRSVQYRVRDRAALDAFLGSDFGRGAHADGSVLGAAGTRALVHREEFLHGAETRNCLNCGEVLRGQHCAHCGQRARIRVLSLWSLLREVLGDAHDWDSRLWRTLRPLAFRPGLLTLEFLRGRRTRYTPPFRMYLLLSVAFFLLATLDSDMHLQIGEDSAFLSFDAPAPQPGEEGKAPPALDAERQRIADTIVDKLPEADRVAARAGVEARIAELPAGDLADVQRAADDPCRAENLQLQLGSFGEQYVPRLRDACRKIVADSKGFGRALYQNVPRTMFLFLPLVALLMTVLYLGSGRFYVEHLLFFVHYHAFFFLGGLAILLMARAGAALQGTSAAQPLASGAGALTAIFVVYAPLYLYFAMRRVYGQGRLLTLFKFALLGVGYLVGMVMTILGLLLYTALAL